MSARDDAAQAGQAAAAILTAAEKVILAAMSSAAAKVTAGTLNPQMARRRVQAATSAALGAASARLAAVYTAAAEKATGRPGPLPGAPGQVAAAILRAQQDAAVAFGAVLAAMEPEGSRMPPPSSPYRRIVTRAMRGSDPAGRAGLAIAAIGARGLTGYRSPAGRRVALAIYAQRAVRQAAVQLARAPVMSEIAGRREKLLAQHVAAVTAAWTAAAGNLDASPPSAAFLADSRVSSTAPDPAVAKRWRQEAAMAAVQGWLAGIYQTGAYAALAAAMESVVRDGMAEGEADAMAAAAWQQKLGTFSTEAAFGAAVTALLGSYAVTRQAQEMVTGLIAGVAADAARALAGLRADSSAEDAAAVLREAAAGIAAAGRWVERALWGAIGDGGTALWKRAAAALGGLFGSGAEMISWDTDSNPCVICQENADDGPYAPQDVPPYLAHPNCRCSLSSTQSVPLSWLASFLS